MTYYKVTYKFYSIATDRDEEETETVKDWDGVESLIEREGVSNHFKIIKVELAD